MQLDSADLLLALRVALCANFAVLAVVAAVRAPRSGRAGWWATGAFTALALVLLEGWLSDVRGTDLPGWLQEIQLALLLSFPYLLLRFTASFTRLPRWLEVFAAAGLVLVVTVTVLTPDVPSSGSRPLWATLYVVAVLIYWVLLSSVTVMRLWRAGRGQPTVARRRMRLMSGGTAVLAVALLLAAQVGSASPATALLVQGTALVSGLAFGLGFSPPGLVKLSWRRPELDRLRSATMSVLRAHTVEQVGQALLAPTQDMVGTSGAAMVDPAGRVSSAHGRAPAVGTVLGPSWATDADGPAREVVPLGERHGALVLWTSPYTPFFGREEADVLHAMGAVAIMALDRCVLLADERRQRTVLEQAQQGAETARAEAMRANLAKTEFLSRMSHELRTPLNAILGFGQLLELAALEPEDREGVDHILKAGRHLLALINDVLDLSRIEAGVMAISLEPVHAGELVQDALALIQPLADGRAIRLVTDAQGCDLYVMTDRQRCRQILLNLLSNAVKYNHDGGQVEVSCSAGAASVLRIAVRDTGPGIDPNRRQRLFEPFERLGAESTGVEGTGLGLALTKQLVERLGGTIGVESALGAGSTFWIELPVTDAPDESGEPAAAPAGDQEAQRGPRRTLLLVEDNLANLRLVEAMLRRRPDLTVLPAMQGRLAVELAQEHQPDVIVLDLHLPDVPGREILVRLQADPRTRDIPVVVASADATPGRLRQLREEGAFDYVTKPLEVGRFLQVVNAALARRDAARGAGEQAQGPSPNG